jgi:hypothetical protein
VPEVRSGESREGWGLAAPARSAILLSGKDLCIAFGILKDIDDLVRRLRSEKILNRSLLYELIQWFTVELPSAGADKVAVVKPSNRLLNFCAAVLASCSDDGRIHRSTFTQCTDSIGLGGIEEPFSEISIECHDELIGLPNVPDEVSLLASGTKACSAGDVPEVPKGQGLTPSAR